MELSSKHALHATIQTAASEVVLFVTNSTKKHKSAASNVTMGGGDA